MTRFDDGAIHGIPELFDPGSETSLPTTFSVFNFLLRFASALLFASTVATARTAVEW